MYQTVIPSSCRIYILTEILMRPSTEKKILGRSMNKERTPKGALRTLGAPSQDAEPR